MLANTHTPTEQSIIWMIRLGAVVLTDFTTHPEHPVYALITKYLRGIFPYQAPLYLFR